MDLLFTSLARLTRSVSPGQVLPPARCDLAVEVSLQPGDPHPSPALLFMVLQIKCRLLRCHVNCPLYLQAPIRCSFGGLVSSSSVQLRTVFRVEVFQCGCDQHCRLATAGLWCTRRVLLQIDSAGRTLSWNARAWQSRKVVAVVYPVLTADV
jgi:hypothetical protein